ncbi:hypothetical protein [Agromyces arachidis]|uniref:hypothetical protein n=1 Tax=Agromyces arachidis TaxID=766966 RepID=UPI0040575BE5
MELAYWLVGIGVIVVSVSAVLVVRERRVRRRPGDAGGSLHGERSHSEAVAAAHTAGVAKHSF